jgi:hypothetical protein
VQRTFTITTPSETVPVAADGRAEIVFTVANTSGVPNRAMARIVSIGNTRSEWIRIDGEVDHEFPTNGTFPFTVVAAIPKGISAGRYSFRLDVVSAQKSGQDYIEGPTIALQAPARPIVVPPLRWPRLVAIFAVLAVISVTAVLLLRPRPDAAVASASKKPDTVADSPAKTPAAPAADPSKSRVASERHRAEEVTAAWFAGFRDHDVAALVALTDVPFYFGTQGILPNNSDLQRALGEIFAAGDTQTLVLRHLHAKTIAEWKTGGVDLDKDRVVSGLSMADTDWRVDLGLGYHGHSRIDNVAIFIRFIDDEPKIVGFMGE